MPDGNTLRWFTFLDSGPPRLVCWAACAVLRSAAVHCRAACSVLGAAAMHNPSNSTRSCCCTNHEKVCQTQRTQHVGKAAASQTRTQTCPANQTQPYKPVQCRRLPCGMLSTLTVSSMYNSNLCLNHDRQPRLEKAPLKPPAHPAVIPCRVGPLVTGSLYRPVEHGPRLLSPISPVCQSYSTVADSKGARQHTVLPAALPTCWNDTRIHRLRSLE